MWSTYAQASLFWWSEASCLPFLCHNCIQHPFYPSSTAEKLSSQGEIPHKTYTIIIRYVYQLVPCSFNSIYWCMMWPSDNGTHVHLCRRGTSESTTMIWPFLHRAWSTDALWIRGTSQFTSRYYFVGCRITTDKWYLLLHNFLSLYI